MGEYTYKGSSIVGSPITYTPTGRFPLVGGTVFKTLADLRTYISSSRSTAIGGSILFVVADTNPKNNGAYEILFHDTTLRNDDYSIKFFKEDGTSNLIENKLGGTISGGGDEPVDGDIHTEKCELKNVDGKQKLIFTLTNHTIYDVDVSELLYQSQATTTQDYVQINVDTNTETKIQTITATTKTVRMEDAREADGENAAVDGLVTANNLKNYINNLLQEFLRDNDAVVTYNEETDKLEITKEGTIGADDIREIEEYVSNNDAGTYLVN